MHTSPQQNSGNTQRQKQRQEQGVCMSCQRDQLVASVNEGSLPWPRSTKISVGEGLDTHRTNPKLKNLTLPGCKRSPVSRQELW